MYNFGHRVKCGVQIVVWINRVEVRQDYHICTAKMSVDIDAIPDLLLLILQKLCIVQYRCGSLSKEPDLPLLMVISKTGMESL